MTKARIFIGSSTEQRPLAQDIAKWLEQAGADAVPWWEDGSFRPGTTTIQALHEAAARADGAVFVFAGDDKLWYRGNPSTSVRDNVLFEYGLFQGYLHPHSPERVIFCKMGSPKGASDLEGVIYINVLEGLKNTNRDEFVRWASRLRPRGADLPHKSLMSTKKELFERGTLLLRNANKSVFLSAKTPIPLMGPRPYDRRVGHKDYEVTQYELYMEFAERAAKGEVDLTIAASIPCVKNDLHEIGGPVLPDRLRANLARLTELSELPNSRLELLWYQGRGPNAFVSCDTHSLLWWKGDNQDSVIIEDSFEALAHALNETLRRCCNTLTRVEVERLVGI